MVLLGEVALWNGLACASREDTDSFFRVPRGVNKVLLQAGLESDGVITLFLTRNKSHASFPENVLAALKRAKTRVVCLFALLYLVGLSLIHI